MNAQRIRRLRTRPLAVLTTVSLLTGLAVVTQAGPAAAAAGLFTVTASGPTTEGPATWP